MRDDDDAVDPIGGPVTEGTAGNVLLMPVVVGAPMPPVVPAKGVPIP